MQLTIEQHKHAAQDTVVSRTVSLELIRIQEVNGAPIAWVRYPQHGPVGFNLNHGWTDREPDMPLWRLDAESLAACQAELTEMGIKFFPVEISRAIKPRERSTVRKPPIISRKQMSFFEEK